MSQVTPSKVLAEVAAAVPVACRENIVIIGSLAAGYHFFREDESKAVRTKDVDCVLEPFHAAVSAGQTITRQLLDAGWQPRTTGKHHTPGDAHTPKEKLPAVRLYPPGVAQHSEEAWFIELLSVPGTANGGEKDWTRLQLKEGHFGLPTFRFLSVIAFEPRFAGDLGIRYARPEMMALANLLHHPTIKSDLIDGTMTKRSNKDLGRVLAIAILADLDDYRPWAYAWMKALNTCFPAESKSLAMKAGNGLRALLANEPDLREAHRNSIVGLLSSQPPSLEAFRAAGQRVLGDAIKSLEELAARS